VIVPNTGRRAAKSFCVKVSCLPRSAIVVSCVVHLIVKALISCFVVHSMDS
jgi:hypothetical protein